MNECGAPHGFNAPHARTGEPSGETMKGQATVSGDDGTPLKITFEAGYDRKHDIFPIHRTSVSRPVLTADGVTWEVAEISASPDIEHREIGGRHA